MFVALSVPCWCRRKIASQFSFTSFLKSFCNGKVLWISSYSFNWSKYKSQLKAKFDFFFFSNIVSNSVFHPSINSLLLGFSLSESILHKRFDIISQRIFDSFGFVLMPSIVKDVEFYFLYLLKSTYILCLCFHYNF